MIVGVDIRRTQTHDLFNALPYTGRLESHRVAVMKTSVDPWGEIFCRSEAICDAVSTEGYK